MVLAMLIASEWLNTGLKAFMIFVRDGLVFRNLKLGDRLWYKMNQMQADKHAMTA